MGRCLRGAVLMVRSAAPLKGRNPKAVDGLRGQSQLLVEEVDPGDTVSHTLGQ